MENNKEILDAINELKVQNAEILCKVEDVPEMKRDINDLKNFKSFMLGAITLGGVIVTVIVGIIKYN